VKKLIEEYIILINYIILMNVNKIDFV